MHHSKDPVLETLQEIYGWHPLMANVTAKVHAFFVKEGLEPRFFNVNTTFDAAASRVKYTEEDAVPVKSALFRRAGLAIAISHQLLLRIAADHMADNKVDLFLKEIGGTHQTVGSIPELYIPGQDTKGQFEEKPLENFLFSCLRGPFARLT